MTSLTDIVRWHYACIPLERKGWFRIWWQKGNLVMTLSKCGHLYEVRSMFEWHLGQAEY